MKSLLEQIEKKFNYLIEADTALGTTEPIGLSKIDKKTASNAIGGGFKDEDKEDDIVAGGSTTVPVGDLKPAQTEIIKNKAVGMAIGLLLSGKYKNASLGNIVSKDNYIMDGHHRWAAISLIDPDTSVEVTKIDMEGKPLVTALNLFTKGKLGIEKGNPGKGNVADFTGDNIGKVLDDFMTNGVKGEFPLSPEDVKKALSMMPGANGNPEKGKKLMIANANKLPKKIMPGAPSRVEMPVISPEKVKYVQGLMAKGALDIKPPYASGVEPVKENLQEIKRWQKLAGIIK